MQLGDRDRQGTRSLNEEARRVAWQEKADQPVVFLIVVTLGVIAMMACLTWIGKATGLHGVSSAAQHP
jgi:hypothetical protein